MIKLFWDINIQGIYSYNIKGFMTHFIILLKALTKPYIYDTGKVMREEYLFCYCCDILLYGRLLLDLIGGNICITIWASTKFTTTSS